MCIEEVMRCIGRTVRIHLEGNNWSEAFQHVGLTGHQLQVYWHTLDKRSLEDSVDAGKDLPTLTHLQAVFPRRLNLPIEDMFPEWF